MILNLLICHLPILVVFFPSLVIKTQPTNNEDKPALETESNNILDINIKKLFNS